jgi:fructose-bisphosphate aldolase class II
MKGIVLDRYEAFGTAGNGSKIKPISLDAMAGRYSTGDLDPQLQ